ncbi:unnamed protein product [Caenorhabditis auriculariae]|uniref:CCHC-type domain-containing protein n=1 Tax=Caenorhabditis auriculariae TaxID=2777116 RepID=A0A8S1H028_9PELO|nr:unnamed protein product [Caenorhabditis auriculariae]
MPPPESPPETIVPQDFSKPVKLLTAKTLERTADQAIAKIIDVKNLKNAVVRDFVHTHHIIQKITESQNAKINTIKNDSSAAPPQEISIAASDNSSDDDNGGFLSPTGVVTPTKAATSLQVALNSPACPASLKPSTQSASSLQAVLNLASTPTVIHAQATLTPPPQVATLSGPTLASSPKRASSMTSLQGTQVTQAPVQAASAAPPRVNVLSIDYRNRGNLHSFKGSPQEDFSAFIRAFEDVVNTYETPLTDSAKKAHLLTYLTDNARDRAEEFLTANASAKFDDLKIALEGAFQDPLRAELARQQLRNCCQGASETVDDFTNKVKKLANSAFKQQGRKTVNEKCLEAFIDGLKYDIRFHVKAAAPRDFQTAVSTALRYELWLQEAVRANTIAPSLVPVAMLQPPAPAFPQLDQQQAPKCFYCARTGHLVRECRTRMRDFQQQNRQYSDRGDFNWNNNQNRDYSGRPRDPVFNHQILPPGQSRQFNQSWGNQPNVQAIHPEPNASRAEDLALIEAQQQQIEALLKRNNEMFQNQPMGH